MQCVEREAMLVMPRVASFIRVRIRCLAGPLLPCTGCCHCYSASARSGWPVIIL